MLKHFVPSDYVRIETADVVRFDCFNIENYATNGFKVHFDYGRLYILAILAPAMFMAATTIKPRIEVYYYMCRGGENAFRYTVNFDTKVNALSTQ